MNNRVAIASVYFQKNYGSMLQALATQMVLDKLGYENDTIDISGFSKEIQRTKMLYFAKAALTSDILFSKMGMVKNVLRKALSKGEYADNAQKRKTKFDTFEKKHFRLTEKCSSKAALTKMIKEQYNTVLVGSDQLWLPGNIAADYFTLNWVPDDMNKIAYATSFGQSMLPKDSRAKACIFLRRINHISVREESGQKLIKQITGRNVPVVCDPTLLFSGEEWMTIQENDPLVHEPYIFAYFLGNNPPHRDFVKRLKKETGYKIVALTHLDEYIKSDEGYADYTPFDIDPGDFLNLIRNAEYICTDSFHCSVFAMQYRKAFFTFRRFTRKTASSTNSRLDTLVNLAGLRNRIVTGDEDVKECLAREINYEEVNDKLKKIREQSYDYLLDALQDKGETDL